MVVTFIITLLSVSGVSDEAILQQANECGLSPNLLVWSVDESGHRRADVMTKGDLDAVPYGSLTCMLNWAKKTGARVGFVSDPPPTAKEVAVVNAAARKCGLPNGTLHFQRNATGGFDIRINRAYPIAEQRLTCALDHLPDEFSIRYGVGPFGVTSTDLPSGQ